MDERQEQQLIAAAQLGSEMRDFCKHPGFTVLMRWIDAKVEQGHKEWMTTQDPKKREELWYKAQPYAEFQAYLKKLLIEGDHAAHTLHEMQSQDALQ